MARQFVDHGASRQEIDRLLEVFSRLDDASVEDERLAISLSNADNGRKRPRARLSEPVLQQESVQALLDGARQSRAFAQRLHTASPSSGA
jgi:hypothetical protein